MTNEDAERIIDAVIESLDEYSNGFDEEEAAYLAEQLCWLKRDWFSTLTVKHVIAVTPNPCARMEEGWVSFRKS